MHGATMKIIMYYLKVRFLHHRKDYGYYNWKQINVIWRNVRPLEPNNVKYVNTLVDVQTGGK